MSSELMAILKLSFHTENLGLCRTNKITCKNIRMLYTSSQNLKSLGEIYVLTNDGYFLVLLSHHLRAISKSHRYTQVVLSPSPFLKL